MTRIGIYYGSTGGATADVASQIAEALAARIGEKVTLADIAKTDMAALKGHEILLIGSSTWNWGDLQDDWDVALPKFAALDLTGKKLAFFGCGDQYGYPDTFGDALATLWEAAEQSGATLCGKMPLAGYDCSESRAALDGEWIGLLLDEDNESERTPERISAWLNKLLPELGL